MSEELTLTRAIRILQEMLDEGTITVKKTDENDALKHQYAITDFGHWLVETKIMYAFAGGDDETKAKIRKQYEEQK